MELNIDERNIIIINLHDDLMKYYLKEDGCMPFRMGEVNEDQMQKYKVIIKSFLHTLTLMDYELLKEVKIT